MKRTALLLLTSCSLFAAQFDEAENADEDFTDDAQVQFDEQENEDEDFTDDAQVQFDEQENEDEADD